MGKFKVGDLVTPINAVDYEFRNAREHLLGKVLMVTMVLPGEEGVNVRAGIVEGKEWYWFSDDLRLVSAVQPEPEADPAPAPAAPDPTDPAPAPAAAQKPLRRGDLVMCRGQVGVVHEIDRDGDYWVAMLTGDGGCVCRGAEDLTRVGSISKKVKQIKKEMEGAV